MKELTQKELSELKEVGIVAANWYAVRHCDNLIPVAIFCNEQYAVSYRDQFTTTSIVEPWPMIVKDLRQPIKEIINL